MTAECGCGERISELDERLDDLVLAMAQWPDVGEVAQAASHLEAFVSTVDVDSASAVDALAAANIWQAFSRVAIEVQRLKETRDGCS